MSRLRVRSTLSGLRPLRARRLAVAVDEPTEGEPFPWWPMVGTGVLCVAVAVELVVAVIWP